MRGITDSSGGKNLNEFQLKKKSGKTVRGRKQQVKDSKYNKSILKFNSRMWTDLWLGAYQFNSVLFLLRQITTIVASKCFMLEGKDRTIIQDTVRREAGWTLDRPRQTVILFYWVWCCTDIADCNLKFKTFYFLSFNFFEVYFLFSCIFSCFCDAQSWIW